MWELVCACFSGEFLSDSIGPCDVKFISPLPALLKWLSCQVLICSFELLCSSLNFLFGNVYLFCGLWLNIIRLPQLSIFYFLHVFSYIFVSSLIYLECFCVLKTSEFLPDFLPVLISTKFLLVQLFLDSFFFWSYFMPRSHGISCSGYLKGQVIFQHLLGVIISKEKPHKLKLCPVSLN